MDKDLVKHLMREKAYWQKALAEKLKSKEYPDLKLLTPKQIETLASHYFLLSVAIDAKAITDKQVTALNRLQTMIFTAENSISKK